MHSIEPSHYIREIFGPIYFDLREYISGVGGFAQELKSTAKEKSKDSWIWMDRSGGFDIKRHSVPG